MAKKKSSSKKKKKPLKGVHSSMFPYRYKTESVVKMREMYFADEEKERAARTKAKRKKKPTKKRKKPVKRGIDWSK